MTTLIPDVLARGARDHGDKTAIIFEDSQVTYAELDRRTTALAAGLAELGVSVGDRVVAQMGNHQGIIDVWFASAKLGACFVPINTEYVGTYLHHQLATAKAQVVVVDADLASGVVDVAPTLPDLLHLVVRGAGADLSFLPSVVKQHDFDELLEGGSGELPEASIDPDEAGAILFTAGTTGPSKGVMMAHAYLTRAAHDMWATRDGQPSDICYNPLPLFHANAMLVGTLGPLIGGATAAIDRRFSVSRFWDRVTDLGATQLCLLGSMIAMIWGRPADPADASTPGRILFGAPVPASFHREFEERFGLTIVVAYGLTEATPLTMSGFDDPPPPGTSGRVNPGFEARIVDDNAVDVPAGVVGELICRSVEPNVMFSGYFGNPEAYAAVVRDGWFHTGDMGSIDDDGWFRFADRKKDYLRRRGENISSFEVEAAIAIHPDVAEVAVHAVPSDVTEDDVKACIVLREGTSPTMGELFDHCVANIPYFAVPRYLELLDELPRNPAGRVTKYALRERAVTPQTWDSEAEGLRAGRRAARR